ncbi:MAG: hypothetical protein WEB09_08650 [Nitriliruptor sp.]
MATTPEDVVRAYLRWREDPDSVEPDTAELDARIEAASDPVERVKLRSERARLADVAPRLEAEFVANVAEWARAHGVTVDALLEEGVERRLLAEAGLVSGTPRSGGAAAAPREAKGRTGRTGQADIEAHVRGLRAGTTFTTATLATDVGGSMGTIRKALDGLLADQTITEAGKDHSGPGRPRNLYARS